MHFLLWPIWSDCGRPIGPFAPAVSVAIVRPRIGRAVTFRRLAFERCDVPMYMDWSTERHSVRKVNRVALVGDWLPSGTVPPIDVVLGADVFYNSEGS